MFLGSFAVGPWQTNTYLVGDQETKTGDTEIVVIDPGVEAFPVLQEIIEKQNLKIAAVLLTHGHIDHIASANLIAEEYQVPVWIHEADRMMLTDPAQGVGAESALWVKENLGYELQEPQDLRFFVDNDEVTVANLSFKVVHAPGHTPGSCLLVLEYPNLQEEYHGIVFSGDVLFAGSVGRTDLPNGNDAIMRDSLKHKVLALADDLAVLPGHGPQTSMARERSTNPFLQNSYLAY